MEKIILYYMENDFLHKIDLDALQEDTKLSLEKIAELASLKNPKALYKWAQDKDGYGTRPSYNAIIRLLEAGAKIETLFGVKYKGPVTVIEQPIKISDEDISRFLQRAADALKKNPQ